MKKILFLIFLCLSNAIYAYDKYDIMVCAAEYNDTTSNNCFVDLGLSTKDIEKIEIELIEKESLERMNNKQRQDEILPDLELNLHEKPSEPYNSSAPLTSNQYEPSGSSSGGILLLCIIFTIWSFSRWHES